jgi:hypothetical protein
VAIESFPRETIVAPSVISFFTCGIQNMDPDNVVCLYLTVVEGIGELQSEDRLMSLKAAFIAGLRPDVKETLVELFPIQVGDVMDNVLFGQKGIRTSVTEPSESDSESDGADDALFEQVKDFDNVDSCAKKL